MPSCRSTSAAKAGTFKPLPVILASGDKTFTEEIKKLIPAVRTVTTREAIGSSAARLLHPDVVKKERQTQIKAALKDLKNAKPLPVQNPIEFVLKVDAPTRADVAMGIPGMKRVDGCTVAYQAKDMDEAYKLIRVIYKYLQW
ncbi:M55 family metallopeptidase [Imperialibacter roseus]|uniref:M55 family metallopeptidase n=1 Tax=Imperialibacter roseus TaxID=1324217 RepID=A0ABZ0IKN8_9BACT|nr:M55 family metallopeptidase [Imperialibacter roseus]WOK05079.1 M55 family metallopeptidase [Imperialibacter roseus]